ncbi:hypothetical protein [Nostoc sp. NMS8]|uniref:hypothetical protein n=1 Tax=Nostoc sp. NMS8 TaxID=2815392 RepID=UPI0025F0BEFA|nr:hypothetical protein [Nostoc sp. NMS8]MBN3961491.1 hypothetical protein [Nostoc sp. NMS8]
MANTPSDDFGTVLKGDNTLHTKRLVNGAKRLIHGVQRLVNGVQKLIHGVQRLIHGNVLLGIV